MAQSKLFTDPEEITNWLASTGYLFPRNELELKRYNKLFDDGDNIKLTDSNVSLDRIFSGQVMRFPEGTPFQTYDKNQIISDYKMVARNGLNGLPEHILNKMLNNQNKNDASKKEEDK
ncbi:hypothetical protein [Pedobacter jeongneungensis]|uniref:hypothetical protein n=1 Tax=Pedobacter jeongneungensis TaxID=947309 RepID=UPI000469485E|nr:hypothetical protein [Pedobacter jeongneungensis]